MSAKPRDNSVVVLTPYDRLVLMQRKDLLPQLPVVPWARVNGQEVHTNGYEEDALGLTQLIAGWGPQGYYVARRVKKRDLQKWMQLIDWERVVLVKETFEIRIPGLAVYLDKTKHFVTMQRYQLLMKSCIRTIPQALFEQEVRKAKKNGRPTTYYGE